MTLNPVQGVADVNGARLWYESVGEGPPLVLAHGHLLDSGQWDEQVAPFAERYRVIRYDARGFGRSDKPAAPFAYYEDLRGLLDALGIERAALIGCSGGGGSVLDFALAYPERAAALVLVGSALSGFRFENRPIPELLFAMREALQRRDLAAGVEYSLRIWTDGEGRSPEQVNQAARERTRAMTTRFFSRPPVEAEERALEPPAIDRLAELRAPTLVTIGACDGATLQEIGEMIATQAPNARKVVIADAGHHPNMEHPEEFNRIVLEFLADQRW